MKPYRSNLCTFLGREKNIKVLHVYIEEALSKGILDRYYMFDLTRDRRDQIFLIKEYHRLRSIYRDKVILVNCQKRKSQFKNKSIGSTIGKWGDFYGYLSNFDDNDIIIKVDDDTLFIDVDELEQALKTRWENQSAFLMHSNCINNGVCAYYQAMQNIWRFNSDRLKLFPEGGIAGPLFLWPELAKDCHEQFLNDISQDYSAINQYKLNKNIYFNARVSINFTFMLGKDRDILKKVDEQDEYLISCRMPQKLGRSNMILGNFITSHHSYGAQDPLLKKCNFLKRYGDLAQSKEKRTLPKPSLFNFLITKPKQLLKKPNKQGSCSTIKFGSNYLCPSWLTENYFTIKNTRTNKYLGIKLKTASSSKFWKALNKQEYICEEFISGVDQPQAFCIENNIRNHNQILSSRDYIKQSDRFPAGFVSQFYNENIFKNGIKLVQHKRENQFLIESSNTPESFLCSQESKDGQNISYFFQKDGRLISDLWEVKDCSNFSNDVFIGEFVKHENKKFCNDGHYLRSIENKNFPNYILPRSYQWTIDNHIWEFINLSRNIYIIKCIKNYGSEKFLSFLGHDVKLSNEPSKWLLTKYKNKYKILNMSCGLHINCGNTTSLTKTPSLFEIEI